MIKQYRYEAYPDAVTIPLIDAQLQRAHRYYNVLIGLEQRREAETYAARGLPAPAPRLPLARWRILSLEERERVIQAREEWLALAKAAPKLTAEETEEIRERHNERVREARSRSGLSWGSYQGVEEAVRASVAAAYKAREEKKKGKSKASGEINFKRWDGEGSLAIHFQDPVTWEQIHQGKTHAEFMSVVKQSSTVRDMMLRLRLTRDRQDTTIQISIPKSFTPWTTDRISWIRLKRIRQGTHFKYLISFVADDGIEILSPEPGLEARTLAVDVGWRLRPDGSLRIAAWVDSANRSGELCLPSDLLEAWQKASDIESIRKLGFNAAQKALSIARASWPEHLREETRYAHAWQSSEKLSGFVQRHRGDPVGGILTDPGPGAARYWRWDAATDWTQPGVLELWRQRDRHLLEYAAGLRRRCIDQRLAIFREWTTTVARNYLLIAVEDLGLDDLAELPDKKAGEEDEPAIAAARGRRFLAGCSYLLNDLARACDTTGTFMSEDDPAYTTRCCAHCEYLNDSTALLVVTCAGCGAVYDQDHNAGRNLLRAVQSRTGPLIRSKRQKAGKSGVSRIKQHRMEAAAVRKAKRSKTGS